MEIQREHNESQNLINDTDDKKENELKNSVSELTKEECK